MDNDVLTKQKDITHVKGKNVKKWGQFIILSL